MRDRYLRNELAVNRLGAEYKFHKTLYVAFDFDNTVFDYHDRGDEFPVIIDILKRAKNAGHKLILFTSNTGYALTCAVNHCVELGIRPDYVNESPVMDTVKPYYSILLDDRAGLNSAYKILKLFLDRTEI